MLKRTNRLLMPYMTTGFLLLALRGYYGYWFLFSLWQLSFVGISMNLFLNKINKKDLWYIDAIVLLAVWLFFKSLFSLNAYRQINELLMPVCDFGKFIDYIIPYLFGYYVHKHSAVLKYLDRKLSALLCLFIMLFINRYLFPDNYVLSIIHKILKIISDYSLGVCGSMLFWIWFSHFNTGNKVFALFAFLGKKSLQIYVLHMLFVIQINVGNFWYSSNFPTCITTQIVFALTASSIAIALSLIMDSFLRKCTFIYKILFGEKSCH